MRVSYELCQETGKSQPILPFPGEWNALPIERIYEWSLDNYETAVEEFRTTPCLEYKIFAISDGRGTSDTTDEDDRYHALTAVTTDLPSNERRTITPFPFILFGRWDSLLKYRARRKFRSKELRRRLSWAIAECIGIPFRDIPTWMLSISCYGTSIPPVTAGSIVSAMEKCISMPRRNKPKTKIQLARGTKSSFSLKSPV
jgi:hypothetical protein